MLQQTQVKTVIPYFERWMCRFPDLKTLALASLDEVIKLWEGLGYYSRARYLHESAQKLVSKGLTDITEESLGDIKGLGPYTRGALLNFAFKKRAAAVDGNVLRVMSRLTLFEGDICLPLSRREIEARTLAFLPNEAPWEAMEALIELGALVCKKKPECPSCPLLSQCAAFARGRLDLPLKKKSPPVTHLHRTVLIIESPLGILVKKGVKGQIMADLYEFPWFEGHSNIESEIEKHFGKFHTLDSMEPVQHSFTRYRANLYPYRLQLISTYAGEYEWRRDLQALPFSSGHRKIVEQMNK